MADQVTLQINGTSYTLARGLTVLEAARQVGVYIPTFCFHKHLSVSGNCRMCLVEIKPGPPKPAIACATPIAEGMQVFTESEMVLKARKAVLEFLLLNHPLDCPVCDEAYECRLQDYTYAYGAATSEFVPFHDQKRVYVRKKRGRLFVEMNRCIECTRCVRFFKERAGEHEMERYFRGHKLKIDSCKEAFESPFSINAADLCPVGALEDAKFRFTARNWELTRVPTVCPSCSIGCNIYADSKNGVIKRLLPRENEAVNACFICDHGRHNFDDVNEGRLLTGRAGRDELTPDESAQKAAEALVSFLGRGTAASLALWLSPGLTNEELFAAREWGKELGLGALGASIGRNMRPVVPVLSDILPKTLVSDDKTANSTGAKLLGLASEKRPDFAQTLLAAIEAGQLRGLLVFGPTLKAELDRAPERWNAALAKLELLLQITHSQAELVPQATLAVPCASWAERDGSYLNHQPRLQRTRAVIPVQGGVPTPLALLDRLARATAGHGLGASPEAVFAALAQSEAAFRGLSYAAITDLGLALPGRED